MCFGTHACICDNGYFKVAYDMPLVQYQGYPGHKATLLEYLRYQYAKEEEDRKNEQSTDQAEEEEKCKKWEWSDLPDRFNDFKCYHGWHYFSFFGTILILVGILATSIYYCRMLSCCKRCCCKVCKHEDEEDEDSKVTPLNVTTGVVEM